jgi:hypothetical protein
MILEQYLENQKNQVKQMTAEKIPNIKDITKKNKITKKSLDNFGGFL